MLLKQVDGYTGASYAKIAQINIEWLGTALAFGKADELLVFPFIFSSPFAVMKASLFSCVAAAALLVTTAASAAPSGDQTATCAACRPANGLG
jgi:hypothetical protein